MVPMGGIYSSAVLCILFARIQTSAWLDATEETLHGAWHPASTQHTVVAKSVISEWLLALTVGHSRCSAS